MKRTFRLRYLIGCTKALVEDRFNTFTPAAPHSKTLLIIRTDAIGDYILFRNFLAAIRNSKKYRDYHITLLGNNLWKPIAEAFDKSVVDAFIWFDRTAFKQDPTYRDTLLKDLRSRGFETAVYANAAREFLLGDRMIRHTQATHRIGAINTKTVDAWAIGKLGNKAYTRLIDNRAPAFEFDKNKLFFETLLEETISLNTPVFDLPPIERQKRILLMPGAGEPARQWDLNNFVELGKTIAQHYPEYALVITGGPQDSAKAGVLMQALPQATNLTGTLPLNELVLLMAGSALVVAHDSGGLHMAIATRTPVIGIMTGKHYKRFAPYSHQPSSVYLHFPVSTATLEHRLNTFGPSAFEDVQAPVNRITVDAVWPTVKAALSIPYFNKN